MDLEDALAAVVEHFHLVETNMDAVPAAALMERLRLVAPPLSRPDPDDLDGPDLGDWDDDPFGGPDRPGPVAPQVDGEALQLPVSESDSLTLSAASDDGPVSTAEAESESELLDLVDDSVLGVRDRGDVVDDPATLTDEALLSLGGPEVDEARVGDVSTEGRVSKRSSRNRGLS